MGIWLQKGLSVSVPQQHFPTVVPLQEAEIQEMILLGEAIKRRYYYFYYINQLIDWLSEALPLEVGR